MTQDLLAEWTDDSDEPAEIYSSNATLNVPVPAPDLTRSLAVLDLPIDSLRKSNAYPYGFTDLKVQVLSGAEIRTVEDLALASDATLRSLDGIGEKMLNRIKNTVAQAIWM